MKNDVLLLDCTLRDGGYVNDWKWGFHKAQSIIKNLVKANVDIVEVGFLRNVDSYNPDVTVCNTIEELNKLLPADNKSTLFSAMAMRSNYNVDKLSPYNGRGIEIIRVTAHDYDILEGLEFAKKVIEKGYKVSINPINIMGYDDETILSIIKKVNTIMPYQFAIVDTFGSMKRRDLDRIVSLVDNNLSKDIRLALHLHENMSLSCLLAQVFLDKYLDRPTSIDASLCGMGRIPGNLPIELIADYMNDTRKTKYDIDYLMDAIQDYIYPLKGKSNWGYNPSYYLSARHNLHRNYAEYYLNKGDLTSRDINHILSQFDKKKTTAFDKEYADQQYEQYKSRIIDDQTSMNNLKKEFIDKKILVVAPGSSLNAYQDKIASFINNENVIAISINFKPTLFDVDYVFVSNPKRFNELDRDGDKIIATSNIDCDNIDCLINYNSISSSLIGGCNSLIMIIKLLSMLGIGTVYIAGADGYDDNGQNYYQSSLVSVNRHSLDFNKNVRNALRMLNVNCVFITPSKYED